MLTRWPPQLSPWFAAVPAFAALFLVLRLELISADPQLRAPTEHFYAGVALAAVNVVLAAVATLAALRTSNLRIVLLALSFVTSAGLFALHGLATPGFLVGGEYATVTGFAARLSLLGSAVFLAASAIDWPQPLMRRFEPWAHSVLACVLGATVAFDAGALLFPSTVPPRVMSAELFLNGSLVIVLACTAFAVWRYVEGYRHSGNVMYGAAALGAALVFEAQLTVHFSQVWNGSWWLYHLQLLAGSGAILGGVLVEYRRGRGAAAAIERLTMTEALAQIKSGYTDVVRALAASLEARDPYTHGHGHRVAALSFLIGRELGLSPERLRSSVQGALLHDVGKIGVSDTILLKPDRLTLDEFEQIKQHPTLGEHMLLSTLTGSVERAVVRHHHEWYDGSGYPDGLAGEEIPLEARIVAVADVYDALRSDRAYRRAWAREHTLRLVRSESGSHLDPVCVAAFEQVVGEWEREFSEDAELRRLFTFEPSVEAAA